MTAPVLSGEVIYGDQRGRLLGFPTANIRVDADAGLRFGVYAGRLDGRPAAISFGVRPTFGADREPLLEAYVLDFAGDLYGRNVRVELVEFVRRERAFDAVEDLVAQVDEDVRAVRDVFTSCDRASVARVERATEALARGEMVVLDGSAVEDGTSQLVVAAGHADAAAINRLAADARGLVELAMTSSSCRRLGLHLQGTGGNPTSGRNHTLSIEARHGVTTGISAQDRAVTIAAAIASDATAADVVVPGHVFPVRTADGGVLERAAAAEAAVDLARIAQMQPAAVVCTMLDDAGEAAGGAEVGAYAERHELAVVSLADVLAYRRASARDRAGFAEYTTGAESGA